MTTDVDAIRIAAVLLDFFVQLLQRDARILELRRITEPLATHAIAGDRRNNPELRERPGFYSEPRASTDQISSRASPRTQ
jgi:hypothetical protein